MTIILVYWQGYYMLLLCQYKEYVKGSWRENYPKRQGLSVLANELWRISKSNFQSPNIRKMLRT